MAVRLSYHIEASVSSSPSDAKDLGNACFNVTSDAQSEGGIWKTKVLKNVTVTLPLDSIVEATFLMLRVTASDPTETLTPVNITLNGTATLGLAPVGNTKEANFLMSAEALTSLTVSNTALNAVDIDVIIGTAGD